MLVQFMLVLWVCCRHRVGAQSLYSLRCMIATCEEFINKYQIDFNPTKSKLICFNANIDHKSHIILNGQPVSVDFKDKHLGNYISSSINDRHIIENTCDIYQRSKKISKYPGENIYGYYLKFLQGHTIIRCATFLITMTLLLLNVWLDLFTVP